MRFLTNLAITVFFCAAMFLLIAPLRQTALGEPQKPLPESTLENAAVTAKVFLPLMRSPFHIYLPLILAPPALSDPVPAHGAIAQGINMPLAWSVVASLSDDLRYTILFEADNPTPTHVLVSDVRTTNFDAEARSFGTRYYFDNVILGS